jgi:hypothetical protein
MAGQGIKNYTAETATSGDVDGYLMQQTIPVFASEAARDSAYTAASITPADGMYCTTNDTNSLWRHDGTSWLPQFTPWVDYTPAWTNLTVGNGVVVAKARYVGGDLHIRGNLTWGTTTSADGGVVYQTIPYSEMSDAAGASGAGAIRFAAASPAIGPAVIDIAASDTAINWFSIGGPMTDSVPSASTTGDLIRWNIIIPVA